MRLIKRLWRGEVSLAKTYWLYGVLLIALISVPLRLYNHSLESDPIGTVQKWGNATWYILIVVSHTYALFIYVAIWRSANNYTGRKLWAALAKIFVLFGLVMMAGTVGKFVTNLNTSPTLELKQTAEMLNRGLPKMVNEVTQFYHVSTDEMQLTLHFRLIGREFSVDDVRRMEPGVVATGCDDLKSDLEKGYTFLFSYRAQDNSLLGTIEVSRGKCPSQ